MPQRPNTSGRESADTQVMRYTASDGTAAHDGECDDRDRINVVILYDRADAGERAMNKVRRIADDLADDIELHIQLWRLDVLLDSRAASTAATDLATVDLLLLALEDARSLNARGCRQLLETLHQLRGLDVAVAILAHDETEEGPSRFDFLEHAAEDAGIKFLFPLARSAPARTEPTVTALHVRAIAMRPVLGRILKEIDSRPHRPHQP